MPRVYMTRGEVGGPNSLQVSTIFTIFCILKSNSHTTSYLSEMEVSRGDSSPT